MPRAYTIHAALAASGLIYRSSRALALADRAEDAFRQTMLGARGDLTVFWANALVSTISTLAVLMLLWPSLTAGLDSLKGLLRARRA